MSLLGKKEVTIIMVTSAVGPVLRKNEETGVMQQKSRVFKAGEKYTVAHTPEVQEWLDRRFAYLADQPQPTEPPVIPPFISSPRIQTEHEKADDIERVDAWLDRIEHRLEKRGLLSRFAAAVGLGK